MPHFSSDSPELRYLSEHDARLKLAFSLVGDLEYDKPDNPFMHIVDTIVGQMLSNKVADVLSRRLWSLFPSHDPKAIASTEIATIQGIGVSHSKAEAIYKTAQYIVDNPNFFQSLEELNDDDVIARLTALRGIGVWSAKMYLIFVLDRRDVVPIEDGAFLQAAAWLYSIKDYKELKKIDFNKMWKPYSSIAARYLYRLLDMGFTKQPLSAGEH